MQLSRTLLDVDRIIVPVNIGNTHWTCVLIDLQNHCLVYYNSMVGTFYSCWDFAPFTAICFFAQWGEAPPPGGGGAPA